MTPTPDLGALIATTGLQPAVEETLRRLEWEIVWPLGRRLFPLIGLIGLLVLISLFIFSGFLFTRSASRRMDVPQGKAAGAYALVVIASNVAYGLFSLAYLALVGGL